MLLFTGAVIANVTVALLDAGSVSDSPNQFAANNEGVHWKKGCAAPTSIVPATTKHPGAISRESESSSSDK